MGVSVSSPIGVRSSSPTYAKRNTRAWGHWLGRYGEEAAARYLHEAGYHLLARNWVCREPGLRGELDLVARYRRYIVIFEVKTRAGGRLAHPAQAVTEEKLARLRQLASMWMREYHRNSPPLTRGSHIIRVDVIAIRTEPRPPYKIQQLDHLVGVA
jgi:putative endonuclease